LAAFASENEDSFIHEPAAMIFGIADGVGGLPGGAEAWSESVEVIVAELMAVAPGAAPDLTRIVHQANQAVIDLVAKSARSWESAPPSPSRAFTITRFTSRACRRFPRLPAAWRRRSSTSPKTTSGRK